MNKKNKVEKSGRKNRYVLEEVKDFHQYTDHIVFIDSSPDEMKYYSILPNYHMSVRNQKPSGLEGTGIYSW